MNKISSEFSETSPTNSKELAIPRRKSNKSKTPQNVRQTSGNFSLASEPSGELSLKGGVSGFASAGPTSKWVRVQGNSPNRGGRSSENVGDSLNTNPRMSATNRHMSQRIHAPLKENRDQQRLRKDGFQNKSSQDSRSKKSAQYVPSNHPINPPTSVTIPSGSRPLPQPKQSATTYSAVAQSVGRQDSSQIQPESSIISKRCLSAVKSIVDSNVSPAKSEKREDRPRTISESQGKSQLPTPHQVPLSATRPVLPPYKNQKPTPDPPSSPHENRLPSVPPPPPETQPKFEHPVQPVHFRVGRPMQTIATIPQFFLNPITSIPTAPGIVLDNFAPDIFNPHAPGKISPVPSETGYHAALNQLASESAGIPVLDILHFRMISEKIVRDTCQRDNPSFCFFC